MKDKRRDILNELGSLQKKEAKSLSYRRKSSHKKNQESPTQATTFSNERIDSYFQDTSTTTPSSDSGNADERSTECSAVDNPSFLEI